MEQQRMTDDPRVDGLTLLILDEIHPALHHAMDYGKEAYPDDDDPEFTHWMNGAIFGAVATYVVTDHEEATTDEILRLYVCVTDVISDVIDRYGSFNLDQYAQDLLAKVGFDGPDAEEVTP